MLYSYINCREGPDGGGAHHLQGPCGGLQGQGSAGGPPPRPAGRQVSDSWGHLRIGATNHPRIFYNDADNKKEIGHGFLLGPNYGIIVSELKPNKFRVGIFM